MTQEMTDEELAPTLLQIATLLTYPDKRLIALQYAADAIERLTRERDEARRMLAAHAERDAALRQCAICGGLVDLRNAVKPTVSIGVGNKSRAIARHAARTAGKP